LDIPRLAVDRDHDSGAALDARGGRLMVARARSRRLVAARLRAGAPRVLIIGFFVIFVLAPLYWVVITSIKPSSDYLTTPPVWFPAQPTLVHYTAALFSYRGLQGLINSLITATSATALSAVMGTMMAYSLARFNTGGQHLAFWVLSQRFLPPVAIVLPIFLLFRNWGLYDTRIGLIIAYTFMTLPLSVWMMYAYFRQLPKSLEEAAYVDGLSRWQAFWIVAVPLAAPGVAAAAVFVFIAVWTEFFFALILTSRYAFTLPTIFRAFLGFQGAQYGEACALATTSLAPSIILGMLVQRHLVRGLTLGALRG
jgi:multiple sugar transport system permease protein